MARSEILVDAPPERVFEVLSDPACYPHWVVGTRRLRGADAGFPAVGTRLHHEVGVGPVPVRDHTEVLDLNPPYRLELRARARPLGTARITLLLEPRGEGAHVTLIEDPADPLTRLVFTPLTHLLVRGRNEESLRRLKGLAERGGPRERSARAAA